MKMSKKGENSENNGNPNVLFDVEALRVSIKDENAFIKDLMDSVPPEIYFAHETIEELREEKHLKADQKLGGIKLKRNGKALSKKTKHKRAKLDPAQKWTVSSIHLEMALNSAETANDQDSRAANDKPLTRDELKKKLHAKLQAMRGTTKASLTENIEKKRLKRRLSKMKMREKRKNKGKVVVERAEQEVKKKSDVKKLSDASSLVFNKEKSLVFNRFDFSETGKDEKIKGKYSGKDYKQLIKKVEHDEEKLKALEEKDSEKATIVKEKKKWKTVLSRAEGIKVKDDLPMLKKALNKKNQRKKRSANKWKDREDTVKNKQEARQKKRTENIQARKKEKIKKKIKRSIKKGRMIAGVQNLY